MWFRSTDGGQGLAMSGWQSSKDTVENKVNFCNVLFAVNVVHLSCQIPAIANFYMTVYGDKEDANVSSSQCSPRANKMWANQADGGSLRFAIPSLQDPADRPTCRERTLELATSCPPSPAQGPGELMMIVSHRCSHRCTRCSDCPNRHCVNCPDKETRCKDCKTKCSRAREDLMVLNIS